MVKVLIIDPDPIHAAELEGAMQTVNCEVSVCSELGVEVDVVKAACFDVIVIVPRSPAQWRKDLGLFCDAMRLVEQRPPILCVLRWPSKDPGDRLYGDLYKVRVLHE